MNNNQKSQEKSPGVQPGLAPAGLLGCPFCGGEAQVLRAAEVGKWYARCNLFKNRCYVMPRTNSSDSPEDAAEMWNTRKQPNEKS
jgi:Restriction alleviation protein Lar